MTARAAETSPRAAPRRRGMRVVAGVLLVTVLAVGLALLSGVHIGREVPLLALPETPGKTAPPSENSTPARAVREPFTDRVHALGRLEPASRIVRVDLPSGNEGSVVTEVLVDEGAVVTAGTILARLDTHPRRLAHVARAEAALAAAEARLAQVLAGAKQGDLLAQQKQVELWERQSAFEKSQLARITSLSQRFASTEQELENAKFQYDRAVLEAQRAAELLKSLREVRATDVAVAEQQIAVTRGELAVARAEWQATEVRAPIAGQILKIHSRGGEKPGANGLLEMGETRPMHAVAEVFEGDLGRITAGMAATVTVDSLGDRFDGVVVGVGSLVGRKDVLSNDPVSDTDARVVEVRVALSLADSARVQRLSRARVQVLFHP